MYLFYVDESGQRDYHNNNSRHFVLGALGIAESEWKDINQKINDLKIRVFRSRAVEFKSVNLRNLEKQKRHYLEPYGISLLELTHTVEQLYDILENAPVTLFASVIDKKQIREKYAYPESPTSLAYTYLIKRFDRFLDEMSEEHTGIVIHDLIQEAPSASRSYQRELLQLHEKTIHTGRTDAQVIKHIVEGVHFVETDQSNFLQLADLISYNVFRQFTDYWESWDDGTATREDQFWMSLPMYPFFGRILNKFDRNSFGKVRGCGIKKFPEK